MYKIEPKRKEYTGKILGREIEHPFVVVQEIDKAFEFAWRTLLFCINNNKVLKG